jgi:hypothetical protein
MIASFSKDICMKDRTVDNKYCTLCRITTRHIKEGDKWYCQRCGVEKTQNQAPARNTSS